MSTGLLVLLTASAGALAGIVAVKFVHGYVDDAIQRHVDAALTSYRDFDNEDFDDDTDDNAPAASLRLVHAVLQ
jgi:hypothetical protein